MMNRMFRGTAFGAVLIALSLGACKGDEKKSESAPEKPAQAKPEPAKPEAAKTPEKPEAAPEAAKAEEAAEDYFRVSISHEEPKPTDPVTVSFKDVKVTNSSVSLDKLEEATAELTINMAAIDSGIPKRDGHLASPDYLDSAKFATATVKVSGVKQKEGDTFTAKSEVSAHGVTKTWDIEFKIVEKGEKDITVEATHEFDRNAFGIGKAEGDSVAAKATGTLRVTIPLS